MHSHTCTITLLQPADGRGEDLELCVELFIQSPFYYGNENQEKNRHALASVDNCHELKIHTRSQNKPSRSPSSATADGEHQETAKFPLDQSLTVDSTDELPNRAKTIPNSQEERIDLASFFQRDVTRKLTFGVPRQQAALRSGGECRAKSAQHPPLGEHSIDKGKTGKECETQSLKRKGSHSRNNPGTRKRYQDC